jgi:fermentation-respiration switch protein FrsA (DUF1100 family)
MLLRLACVFALLLNITGCTGFFFQPLKEHVFDPATVGFSYRDVNFEAADGTALHGWFFPAEGEQRGSLLFLHGNAENISTHFANVAWLTGAGFDVLAFDYRGYGRSSGSPDLAGLHQDAAAALESLIAQPEADPDRIAVLGQSLGGAVALGAVAESPHKGRLRALVVEGAFSDYRALAREKLAAFWLTWPLQWPLSLTIDNRYSPKAAAGALSPLPLLIIHGEEDDIVPPAHGDMLFEAAGEPKAIWRLPETGHIQAFATIEMRERLAAYLVDAFADGQ